MAVLILSKTASECKKFSYCDSKQLHTSCSNSHSLGENLDLADDKTVFVMIMFNVLFFHFR